MALSVYTNVASLNGQRQLGKVTSNLEKSFERLSSGLRINSAADDSAGLAITERMEAQIRGMDQARRNAADGVSLAQTVESGLGEVNSILQRLRELSVQSANDTNTTSDRSALDDEASQLISSLDQIASSTEFNGRKVLDGTTTSLTFQTGANNQSDQSIEVSLSGVRAGQLGQLATETSGAVDGSAISGSATGTGALVINGNTVGSSSTYGADVGHVATSNEQENSAYAKAKAVNASGVGVKANANATSSSVTYAAAGAAYTLQINGTTVLQSSSAASQEELVNQINLHSESTGVSAALNGGNIDMTASDGRNINVAVTQGGGGSVTTGATAQGFTTAASAQGTVTLTSDDNITISAGSEVLGFDASGSDSITVDSNNLNTSVDLSTRAGSLESIDRIDAAVEKVLDLRGRMGAMQNRLEVTSSNLAAVSENVSAAKSRIRDADFASESATMTRNQILQQAASAMLSQANQAPNMALQLIR
jgi:flagellin